MNSPKKGEKQKGKRFTTQMKWNSFGFDWNAFKIFFMQSFGFSKMNNDFVWTFEYASQTTNRFDTSPQNFKRMNIRRINDTIRSFATVCLGAHSHKIGFYSTKNNICIWVCCSPVLHVSKIDASQARKTSMCERCFESNWKFYIWSWIDNQLVFWQNFRF